MRVLILICFVLSLLSSKASSSAQIVRPKPADVLQSALKAVQSIESVEYQVHRERVTSTGLKFRGQTTIVASRSPFRFSAKFQGEDVPIAQMAVSDGKNTRVSYDGKTDETSIFALSYPKEKVMPARGGYDVIPDVATTWRLLLDADFLKEAIASENILYVKQEDVEGDLCHVVLYVRGSDVFESVTEYFWISAKTGLPRAVQRLTLMRGSSNLRPRFTISKIRLNPRIAADTFSYRPTPLDSTVETAPKTSATISPANSSLVGSQLPDLEVRDLAFQPVKLSAYGKRPTIISFWATWCAPCLEELPVLQKINDKYKGDLQVLAVGVQDSRLNVVKFTRENPSYKFIFLTDPDMQESESRIGTYFGLNSVPVSIFVDAQGKIVEQWNGFKDGEQALTERIQRLMER